MYQDTIVAISTAVGEGGIGIVRLSGKDSSSIALRLFDKELSDHRLVHGHIRDPQSDDVVDEVLVAYMAAPHTYTREDVVEINCHGGPIPLQRVLGLCLHQGARLANPGEFTLRAFLNGRIDLAQAECVLDVISAKTEASLRLAVEGLRGSLSEKIGAVRKDLMQVLAYLTARIDFPDDDVPEQDALGPLRKAHAGLAALISSADAGMVYRQGVRTAIVGRPNVGKSSLLNRLLRTERAIVTPIPGTTRDTLEEIVNLKGVPFVLIDTAGITRGRDMAEELGIERSKKAISQADFILLVLDSSEALTNADTEIASLLAGKKVLTVANKRDLPSRADLTGWAFPVISTSTVTGKGLAELEEKMVSSILGGNVAASDSVLVTHPRHKEALQKALQHVAWAAAALTDGKPEDLVAIDVSSAIEALGEITGDTVSEELLDTIFSRFCIGK